MRILLLIALCWAAVGCGQSIQYTVTPDERPAFHIDSKQPFWIGLGQGSGWHGLSTIQIDQDGKVVLHRPISNRPGSVNSSTWERGTGLLTPDGLSRVLSIIESTNVMSLGRMYSAGIADGTQWILCINQGENWKRVYFDNAFPEQIQQFDEKLHEILQSSDSGSVTWVPVPVSAGRDHEDIFWDSTP